MSINKIYLPEEKELINFLKENGSHEFYSRFIRKRELFMGPSESHAFIEEFIKYFNPKDSSTFYQIPQLKLF